jgi:mannose-6-phosphate isomerase-like protein (cupin superfamily)
VAYTGQTLSIPLTGERITFLKTARDTQGQRLLYDCRVTSGGSPLPAHVHATQEECFTVFSGVLGVMRGDAKYRLGPGQEIVLPPRVKHQWWNAGDSEVHMRVEVAPPGNLETVLEAICGMAHDGATNQYSMPMDLFNLVNLGRLSETYLPDLPIWMQRSILAAASPMAWLLGYDPDFAAYRTSTSSAI